MISRYFTETIYGLVAGFTFTDMPIRRDPSAAGAAVVDRCARRKLIEARVRLALNGTSEMVSVVGGWCRRRDAVTQFPNINARCPSPCRILPPVRAQSVKDIRITAKLMAAMGNLILPA